MTIHTPINDALPISIEAEQALLGALLISNSIAAAVAPIVDREHFSEPLHQIIYGAIMDASAAGRPADPRTIGAVLADIELPEGSPTPRVYLAHLAAGAVTVRDAPQWALMVRDLAHRREIIGLAQRTIADARDAAITTPGAAILERLAEDSRHIVESQNSLAVEPSSELAWRIVSEIEKARAGEFKVDAFTTGFPDLDKSARYRPGDVVVTAGRPGAGKSVFAACTARRIAEAGIGVLEFPLEIGREQAICRHLSDLAFDARSPICFSWILDRDLRSIEAADRVGAAAKKLNSLPIVVDDSARISISRLAAKVKHEKAKMAATGIRLGLVSLDHLDFIDATDRYAGQRTQEIGEVMLGLKAIARRENVVVHVFSQLNRSVESREDKRPNLADLRNSGDIEQVADVVQFLYRPAYYLEATASRDVSKLADLEECRNVLEVIREKARGGVRGVTSMYVDVGANYIEGGSR